MKAQQRTGLHQPRSVYSRLRHAAAAFLTAFTLALPPTDAAAAAPDQVVRLAELDVALWLPPGSSNQSQPRPLALFSHGFGGCKTQSGYLMRALADQGIVVAAPDHQDNECAAGRPPTSLPQSLINPQNWSPAFHQDRRDDMRRLRAALEKDLTQAGAVDSNRVVLLGHSLGGYTVLAAAGGWPSWHTSDAVVAVIALAPFAQPLLQRGGTLGAITAPVLFQGGTADPLITEVLEAQVFPAAAAASPACLLIYRDAGHLAWTELEGSHHATTAAATVAFVEQVLAGRRPTATALPSAETVRAVCR
jgi:predicted dienelactone hydrolase